MPTDSFTAALARLDPASRALLDLSLRRGMRPEEIGDLLATDPESVVVAREQALDHLAADLRIDTEEERDQLRARLAELPSEAWTPAKKSEDRPRRMSAAAPKPAAERPEKPRRLRLLFAVLGAALIALVISLVAGGASDDGKQSSSKSPQAGSPAGPAKTSKPAEKPANPKPAADPGVPLIPVAGSGDVKGTARLTAGGQRLHLRISGLPRGSYQVWLYNSVVDSESIGGARGGSAISLDAKLPARAGRYRYVDISREPSDGNPNHSGRSVVRVPLKRLEKR